MARSHISSTEDLIGSVSSIYFCWCRDPRRHDKNVTISSTWRPPHPFTEQMRLEDGGNGLAHRNRASVDNSKSITTGAPAHDLHGHPVDHPSVGDQHHISHSVALIAEVADPATAQHIVEEEEQWVKSEAVASTADVSSSLPPSDKIEYSTEANEPNEELQRVKSKASLAAMMADFPDGGKWAYLNLIGATLIAFSTFGISRPLLC
jgi:hypothetical protein